MASGPLENSRFSVASSCLCFGTLHNIWRAASDPIQGFPHPKPELSGTVIIHKLKHNVSAQNGIWITYQLVDIETQEVKAWFACHTDIDPQAEIDKILSVSGSPYEMDSGSSTNNAKTAAEGVLVINRYDWHFGAQDKEFGEEAEDPEVEWSPNCVGLVDYEHAKDQVLQWKDEVTAERSQSSNGAWFYIPHAEYMFCRFGFNDTHTAARSFLFFTESSYFMKTAFLGLTKSLRLDETPEERFHRHLREGDKYEGLESLERLLEFTMGRNKLSPPDLVFKGRPPVSECLGPYDKEAYLFKSADFEALRLKAKAVDFIDPLKEPVYDLLNNMIMSYLEHFIIPVSSSDSILAAAATLCPNRENPKAASYHIYRCLTDPLQEPIHGLDEASVENRIKSFLQQRCENEPLVNDREYIAGVSRLASWLLTEVFDMTSRCSIDNSRGRIVPHDIRMSTHLDWDLRHLFRFCSVYWYG